MKLTAKQQRERLATLKENVSIALDKANARLVEFQPQKENPQVNLMIVKNEGYIMALEDVAGFLDGTYSRLN